MDSQAMTRHALPAHGRSQSAATILHLMPRSEPLTGFSFLSLPPEIRVMIYRELVVVPKGVHIKEQPGIHRKTVFQCHPAESKRSWGHEAVQNVKCRARFRPPSLEGLTKYVIQRKLNIVSHISDRAVEHIHDMYMINNIQTWEQGPHDTHRVWLAILATCRTVYVEAVGLAYDQKFIFASTDALATFLMPLGPAPLASLTSLEILDWGDKRPMGSTALPALEALNRLPNLRRLRIACSLGHTQDWAWSNIVTPRASDLQVGKCYQLPVDLIATKFYRDCVLWLRPMYVHRGGMQAIKRVVRLDERNFMPVARSSYKRIPPLTAELHRKMLVRFWAYLEILLSSNMM